MNNVQLLLFKEPSSELETAIKSVNSSMPLAPNQEDFVRHVGATMLHATPGSVVLAATPSCDGLNEKIAEYLDQAAANGTGQGASAMCFVRIPTAHSGRAMQEKLLDAYHDASCLRPSNRPAPIQFEFQFDRSSLSRDPFTVVTGLVSQRPFDYYVISNASDLARTGSSKFESVESIRYIIKLAKTMGRTHVIFASAAQMNSWLKYVEIAEATLHCVLRPYDVTSEDDKQTFVDILGSYDSILPWREGNCLADHTDEINEFVFGCPYRLRTWIQKALIAHAKDDAPLTWERFIQNRPIKTLVDAALADFNACNQLLGPTTRRQSQNNATLSPAKHYNRKPGQRLPHRDDVGIDAA
ncbi:MAG: hypothetical protein F9K30_18525 [Dechloromonas sp.]|nr:MAG: hypothetical protein F9K30_18525 [Dechloromonas sp.]